MGRLEHLQAALNVTPEMVNARFRSVRTDSQEQHTNDWATPLWFAVVNNRLDTARALLIKGAERTIIDTEGRSIVDHAVLVGEQGMLALLKS